MPAINELAMRYWFGDFGESDTLRDALTTLHKSIAQTNERVVRVQETIGDIDDIPIEEWNFIEALLGCAFVACQGYIALTVSRVKLLHKFAAHPKQGNHTLTTTCGGKGELMKAGDSTVGSNGYTRIEVIDSLANYFKHHEEWPSRWNKASRHAASTIRVISSVGLNENSTTNLQTGLDALGIPNVVSLLEILAAWRSNLCQSYRTELQNRGLLSEIE